NIKEDIASIGKRLYERDLNNGYGGNFSVRDEEYIYITPSGVPKDTLDYSDVLVIDFKGNVLEGNGKPSTEILFHITTYKTRPDVNAIIHAHPPIATGFSIAQHPIPNNIHEECTVNLGEVPIVYYEVTSSKELAESIQKVIKNHNAVLLSNHGALTVGEDLERAYRRMEELESLCKMIIVANSLEGVKPIPDYKLNELMELMNKRK
ncbi:MAG: class II aldolase/adducin family protein, partial [Caldisericaceae bacterium]